MGLRNAQIGNLAVAPKAGDSELGLKITVSISICLFSPGSLRRRLTCARQQGFPISTSIKSYALIFRPSGQPVLAEWKRSMSMKTRSLLDSYIIVVHSRAVTTATDEGSRWVGHDVSLPSERRLRTSHYV